MARKSYIANKLGPAVRPTAKAILKAGLRVYDAAEQHLAEAGERLMDLIAEAQEEVRGGAKVTGKSKKSSSPKRRPES
jgi:hypothetical protein